MLATSIGRGGTGEFAFGITVAAVVMAAVVVVVCVLVITGVDAEESVAVVVVVVVCAAAVVVWLPLLLPHQPNHFFLFDCATRDIFRFAVK